ncbi:MAG: hypothetical protein OXC82_07250 [Rhodobacteraceae bacterium]|nr:hypothetical protein [Paracoccaceae bacterium]
MEQADRRICRVGPTPEEHRPLRRIADSGKGSVRYRRRAPVPLLADEGHKDGGCNDRAIAGIVGVGMATPGRVRRQCVMEGLDMRPCPARNRSTAGNASLMARGKRC